ncbi:hypothetical protein REPUB_Repub10bG0150400 [Reevesia pubescens]
MKHFVLIHGMCHGAQCWYKIVSFLKSAGHLVTPLDLGASGINPKKISELASLSDYAQPQMELPLSLKKRRPENPPTHALFGPNFIVAKVYQLSPKEDIELAKTVLRPGKWFMKDLSKESLLTKEKFGSVNRVYIVCNDDLLIKESLQKWYIEHNPTGDVKTIAGADHMPMFSKPNEVFKCLQEIAEKYN